MNKIREFENQIREATLNGDMNKVGELKLELLTVCRKDKEVYEYIIKQINENVLSVIKDDKDLRYDEYIKITYESLNEDEENEKNINFQLGYDLDCTEVVFDENELEEDSRMSLGYEIAQYYLDRMMKK